MKDMKNEMMKKKLGGLSMPEKRAADKQMELDLEFPSDEGAGEETGDGSKDDDTEVEGSPEDMKEDRAELSELSDEELLAEIKARGLSAKMDGAKKPDEEEGDDYTLRA